MGAGYKEPWVEKNVPHSWRGKIFGIEKWKYAGIFLAILFGLIIKTITSKLIHIVKNLTAKNTDTARHKIVVALEEPFGLIVATGFWFFCLQILKFDGKFLAFMMGIVQVVLSIAIVWAAYRLAGILSLYLKKLASKTETDLDDHLIPLITKSFRVFIIVIGALITVQNLGFNVMSLVAGLGLGGLAFALAAKDTAANFFGSLMILFDRPFKIGDWIKTNDVEGTVEEIGFRSTRLRTFYNSLVSVPNASLANENIDNMGLRNYRRISTTLGLTYSTPPSKLNEFVEGIKTILNNNEFINKETYHVYFNSYGDSSLNVMLYCFLAVPNWSVELQEKERIYTDILNMAQDIGVEFAFPSQSLYIESMPTT
jgi:MscS family membrane protein